MGEILSGLRCVVDKGHPAYPEAFNNLKFPPEKLYILGNPDALQEGLAIVGARKATPYGLSCAKHFAEIASSKGITIISGGARGCDSESHKAALSQNGTTVVFFGSGCDEIYPSENKKLFQQIIDSGGAIVSEHEWSQPALPHQFRLRNRLIAGLAKATLIVEAGLPSGTFTTADYAIEANREVLVIPGAITSKHSHGANRLIYQGAIPIIDDEVFSDQLNAIFGKQIDKLQQERLFDIEFDGSFKKLFKAIKAQPMSLEEMRSMVAKDTGEASALSTLMLWIAQEQKNGRIAKYPDGNYGVVIKSKTKISTSKNRVKINGEKGQYKPM